MYHVWRRSDGYVGACAGRFPDGWGNTTFEPLVSSEDWDECLERIQMERARTDYPTFNWQ